MVRRAALLVALSLFSLTACPRESPYISPDGGSAFTPDAGSAPFAFSLGAPSSGTRACAVVGRDEESFVVATTNGELNGQSKKGLVDTVVMRLNARGEPIWTQQLGDVGIAPGLSFKTCALALTADGTLLLGGTVNGRGTLWNKTLPATYTAVVLSLNALDGAQRWFQLVGDPSGPTEGMGVSALSDGRVVLVGYTRTGTLEGAPSLGEGDVFVAWLNDRGELLTLRRYGGESEEYPSAFEGSQKGLYFARRAISAVGGQATALELTALNFEGDVQKTLAFSNPIEREISAISANFNFVCAAHQLRTFDADAGSGMDFEVSCYDPELSPLWSLRGGAPAETLSANALSCFPGGTCVLGGWTDSALDGPRVSSASGAFVMALEPNRRKWSRVFGTPEVEGFTSVASVHFFGQSGLFAVGHSSGSAFGPLVGFSDLFVLRTSTLGDFPDAGP